MKECVIPSVVEESRGNETFGWFFVLALSNVAGNSPARGNGSPSHRGAAAAGGRTPQGFESLFKNSDKKNKPDYFRI